MTESPLPAEPPPSPRWPWACLVAALIAVAVIRMPLILNAATHLDSDLAVDGLTLLDATQGHLRWHFPGTPHMGAAPVLLALPGAWMFGATPVTLVVGGVFAYEGVVLATFLLAMKAYGPRVAAWSLVPLTFASIGTVWLSGRVSGGHLLTVAWSAGALAWFHSALERGGMGRSFAFGAWCGFGFYLDQMFLSTLVPIAVIAPTFLGMGARLARQILALLVFVVGFAIGDLPREIGYRYDPYDSYQEQFDTILVRVPTGPEEGRIDRAKTLELARGHAEILFLQCLPRLIAGHRIDRSDLPTDPPLGAFPVGPDAKTPAWSLGVAYGVVVLSALILVASQVRLIAAIASPAGPVTLAMLMTAGLTSLGFVMNKNIFNSDNFRYLIPLILPWSLGTGLLLDSIWRRGAGGRVGAAALAATFAVLVSLDTVAWYRGFGWLDGPIPVRVQARDPALAWLQDHPDAGAIFGGYWDVYRLQFLRGGRVTGVPFPEYPDRFNTSGNFPGRRPTLLLSRRGDLNGFYERIAREQGARVLARDRDLTILDWPLTP